MIAETLRLRCLARQIQPPRRHSAWRIEARHDRSKAGQTEPTQPRTVLAGSRQGPWLLITLR